MSDPLDLLEALGVAPQGALAAALDARSNVLALTAASERAAVSPDDPGGLSHVLRAAIALRIARHMHEAPLIAHYERRLAALAEDTEAADAVAEPARGAASEPRLAAILAYVDRVTLSPKDARADDVAALQSAGVGDADIVRLAELVAFLAYQARVAAGLRLLAVAGA